MLSIWKKGWNQKNSERSGPVQVTPRVVRVTPEGRLLYDPDSVVRSEPAQKHLDEIAKNSPIEAPEEP